MPHDVPARRRFQILLRQPEPLLDLAEAALCIAWEEHGVDTRAATLREIEGLAAHLRAQLGTLRRPDEQIAAINAYLFEERGFRGNTAQYNDPANSLLDQVLARRTGLPITLSVLYIALGERLELPISGVALPGHFLVRYAAPTGDIYIDPFHQGRIWNRSACEQQITGAYGRADSALVAHVMQPPTKRAILARMLRNLKHTYVQMNDFARAYAAVERILLLEPGMPQELRDRGLLRLHLDAFHLALDDLEQYAQSVPDAPDLPVLREQVHALAAVVARSN